MSLPIPNLDDRRFQDIVDEARRLIPVFCPEWTNFEPSDPGVTIVELFAWMTEMVLYRLNQVPDVFYTRMLDLMGVAPFPPRAACADITFLLAAAADDTIVVPRGTVVATAGRDPVVFATIDDLVLDPPTPVAALTRSADDSWADVWERLQAGESRASLFSPEPRAGDAFYLGFAGSLAASVLRLDVQAGVDGLGVDPNDPPLVWETWNGEVWLPAGVATDETGGLQRDGAVTLLVAAAHDPLTLQGVRAHWLRLRLAPRPGQQQHRMSPWISSLRATLVGGTVTAEHSQQMPGEVLGVSDGRPDQRFTTRVAPVLPRRVGETVRTFWTGTEHDWQEVDSFIDSGPDDRHFTWDGISGEVRFGPRIRYPDGTTRQLGAVPKAGAEITLTEYRHGGGAAGNVGAQTLSVLRTAISTVDRVVNRSAAFGGLDAESVENAKQRGPLALSRGQQAITAEDYERIALESVPSIARARCLPPMAPGRPVRLLVVPYHKLVVEAELDAFALTHEIVTTLIDAVERRRVLGVEVEIGTPFYQGVTVAALVTARPGRVPYVVQDSAVEAILRFLDPVQGGRDGLGWPFGETLHDHAVVRLLQDVDGVERVEDVVFFEYDLRTLTRVGAAANSMLLADDALFLPRAPRVVAR